MVLLGTFFNPDCKANILCQIQAYQQDGRNTYLDVFRFEYSSSTVKFIYIPGKHEPVHGERDQRENKRYCAGGEVPTPTIATVMSLLTTRAGKQ